MNMSKLETLERRPASCFYDLPVDRQQTQYFSFYFIELVSETYLTACV